MKKYLLIGIIVILTLISCEKLDNDVFLRIGSGQHYKFSDIELYDTSTHILYFKKVQDYFKDTYENTFIFLNKKQIIYQGSFVPGYSSSIPNGPFIMSPPMYGNFALKIENFFPGKTDLRKDQKMIDLLSRQNLLHSGLAITSSSIEINDTQLTFTITITNQDQSDLMIIDPDKTGPNLFHYFTNGLIIYDLDHNKVFTSNIQHQTPDPWDSWKIDWLSDLKSGDSKQFKIDYTISNPLNPGEYETTFTFPGLVCQVTLDQLYQGNSRVWLGGIKINKRVSIQ